MFIYWSHQGWILMFDSLPRLSLKLGENCPSKA